MVLPQQVLDSGILTEVGSRTKPIDILIVDQGATAKDVSNEGMNYVRFRMFKIEWKALGVFDDGDAFRRVGWLRRYAGCRRARQ